MALTGLFRAKWTHSLLKNRNDTTAERLQKTVTLMNEHVQDCIIETLTLPDSDDRYVLAAAIISNADVIVTENLKIFWNLNFQNMVLKHNHMIYF